LLLPVAFLPALPPVPLLLAPLPPAPPSTACRFFGVDAIPDILCGSRIASRAASSPRLVPVSVHRHPVFPGYLSD
jgi:hypothetical protein